MYESVSAKATELLDTIVCTNGPDPVLAAIPRCTQDGTVKDAVVRKRSLADGQADGRDVSQDDPDWSEPERKGAELGRSSDVWDMIRPRREDTASGKIERTRLDRSSWALLRVLLEAWQSEVDSRKGRGK